MLQLTDTLAAVRFRAVAPGTTALRLVTVERPPVPGSLMRRRRSSPREDGTAVDVVTEGALRHRPGRRADEASESDQHFHDGGETSVKVFREGLLACLLLILVSGGVLAQAPDVPPGHWAYGAVRTL